MFCSKECLAKSWKNPVWPHKHECNKMHKQHQSQVGTSLREQSRGIAGALGKRPEEMEEILDRCMEEGDLDAKAASMEELHEQREANEKKKRKAARKKKNKSRKEISSISFLS
jgi:hypothetical protein